MTHVKHEIKKEEVIQSDSFLSYWVEPKEEIKEFTKYDPELSNTNQSESDGSNVNGDKNQLHKPMPKSKETQSNNQNIFAGKKISGNDLVAIKNVNSKKKTKLSTKDTQNIASWKRDLENAPVSDSFKSLCKYQCPTCGKIFTGRARFSVHLLKNKHYEELRKKINDYLIEIVAHKCHICFKRLLCDNITLRDHLRQHHTSIQEYRNMNVEHKLQRKKLNEEFNMHCKTNIQSLETVQEIGDLCAFSCPKCEFSCQSWKHMAKHINTNGHGPSTSPFRHATKVTFHKCHECNNLILCDYILIQKHILKHKLTMKSYRKNISLLPTNEETYLQYLSKIKPLIKHIPIVSPKKKTLLKPKSLPDKQTTSDMGNITFMKCLKCSKTNMSYSGLIRHCRKKHNINYVSLSMEHVQEARYHKCLICSTILLCDNHFLTRHVDSAHKMKLGDYKDKYVLRNGGRALPTTEQFRHNRQVFDSFKITFAPKSPLFVKDDDLISPDMLSSESEDSDEENKY